MPRLHAYPYRDEEPVRSLPAITRPTLDIKVSIAGRVDIVRVLLDTGSPRCLFGVLTAERLGVDMSPRAGRDIDVNILGGPKRTRLAEVGFELPPFDSSWTAEVGFFHNADLDLPFAGVLGQEGVFNKWVASFNYGAGYFLVEEADNFIDRFSDDEYNLMERQLGLA